MYLCADMLSKKETSKDVNKILMLTEQTDNFKKLDATKILALAQTQKRIMFQWHSNGYKLIQNFNI